MSRCHDAASPQNVPPPSIADFIYCLPSVRMLLGTFMDALIVIAITSAIVVWRASLALRVISEIVDQ